MLKSGPDPKTHAVSDVHAREVRRGTIVTVSRIQEIQRD